MKLHIYGLILLLCFAGCQGWEVVKETGRTRPALKYSEEEMAALGAEAYEEVGRDYQVITGTAEAEMVQRVGRKLAEGTGKAYEWEFKLLDSPETINAFCLPGGKVAVFSGILLIAASEDGLAVVLGHEIAHATLQHGNERLSQPTLKRIIGLPVSIGANVWGSIAPRSRRLVMGAFGLGGLVGHFLPYSQEHEFEADEVGLTYMKNAGYNIEEAPKFWQRMIEATPGQQKSDALSTHPDAEKRIVRLHQLILNRRLEGRQD